MSADNSAQIKSSKQELTDLICSPRIAAGEALCLVTHLVSYRGSKNCTKLHLQLGSLKEEFNPLWEYKPCTTIPVFYSNRCEDWTTMEDTSQSRAFRDHNSPFCILGAVMQLSLSYLLHNLTLKELFGKALKCKNKKQEARRKNKLNRKKWKGNLLTVEMGA